MSRTTTTIDEAASVLLPREAVDALGVKAGEELDVEIVGRAIVVRSVEEASRSREFIDTFESILKRRRSAALAAAENRHYYEAADLVTCAATYAYHLTQAHACIDGNKRIAAAITETFLETNGGRLMMTNEEVVQLFLDVASGVLNRDEVEQSLRGKVRKRKELRE